MEIKQKRGRPTVDISLFVDAFKDSGEEKINMFKCLSDIKRSNKLESERTPQNTKKIIKQCNFKKVNKDKFKWGRKVGVK